MKRRPYLAFADGPRLEAHGRAPLEIRTAKEAREKLGWLVRDDDPRFAPQPVLFVHPDTYRREEALLDLERSVTVYNPPSVGPTSVNLPALIEHATREAMRAVLPPPAPRFLSVDVLRLTGLAKLASLTLPQLQVTEGWDWNGGNPIEDIDALLAKYGRGQPHA